MAITIDLPPEEEQALRRRAEMAGQDVAEYLVRSAGLRAAVSPEPLSNAEWEAMLDELGDTAPQDAPLLSENDVSREGIYEGRC